jgi:hypothetical protein
MLELVVFAGVIVAEAALEDAAPVVPDAALALDALGIATGAGAGMALQALPTVAHPGLTTNTRFTW